MKALRQNIGLLGLGIALAWTTSPLHADEVSDTQRWLDRQSAIIRILESKVDRADLPKLATLENAIAETAASVAQTKGIGNQVTLNLFYDLNLKFYFSADLLKPGQSTLRSVEDSPLFDELLDLNSKIAKARNFNDELNRGTTVSASTFTKMYDMLKGLSENTAVDESLRNRIHALIPEMGRAIAIAKGGDQVRDTMDACEAVYREIVALYPDFDRIEASSAAFNKIILIQGLNEFYADYVKLQIAKAAEAK